MRAIAAVRKRGTGTWNDAGAALVLVECGVECVCEVGVAEGVGEGKPEAAAGEEEDGVTTRSFMYDLASMKARMTR